MIPQLFAYEFGRLQVQLANNGVGGELMETLQSVTSQSPKGTISPDDLKFVLTCGTALIALLRLRIVLNELSLPRES